MIVTSTTAYFQVWESATSSSRWEQASPLLLHSLQACGLIQYTATTSHRISTMTIKSKLTFNHSAQQSQRTTQHLLCPPNCSSPIKSKSTQKWQILCCGLCPQRSHLWGPVLWSRASQAGTEGWTATASASHALSSLWEPARQRCCLSSQNHSENTELRSRQTQLLISSRWWCRSIPKITFGTLRLACKI